MQKQTDYDFLLYDLLKITLQNVHFQNCSSIRMNTELPKTDILNKLQSIVWPFNPICVIKTLSEWIPLVSKSILSSPAKIKHHLELFWHLKFGKVIF